MSTIHGCISAAELRMVGLSADEVLDFSSNINPLGPSDRVRQAAVAANLSAYPDRDCLLLREALAERLQVDVAQAAGLAALDDEAHVQDARDVIADSKAFLYEQLGSMTIPFTPSSANFLLVKLGDAHQVRMALLRRGIAVRDCTSFGLRQHIRIAVRRREECERLIRELEEVMDR